MAQVFFKILSFNTTRTLYNHLDKPHLFSPLFLRLSLLEKKAFLMSNSGFGKPVLFFIFDTASRIPDYFQIFQSILNTFRHTPFEHKKDLLSLQNTQGVSFLGYILEKRPDVFLKISLTLQHGDLDHYLFDLLRSPFSFKNLDPLLFSIPKHLSSSQLFIFSTRFYTTQARQSLFLLENTLGIPFIIPMAQKSWFAVQTLIDPIITQTPFGYLPAFSTEEKEFLFNISLPGYSSLGDYLCTHVSQSYDFVSPFLKKTSPDSSTLPHSASSVSLGNTPSHFPTKAHPKLPDLPDSPPPHEPDYSPSILTQVLTGTAILSLVIAVHRAFR